MKNLFLELKNKKETISVIGLGYVGLPLAIALSKKFNVIGYDYDKKKIEQYKLGEDPTNEVGTLSIKSSSMIFTSDVSDLKASKFHIVTVPTPINGDKTPDLSPIEGATEKLGENLMPGSIVVYESTVYPGVTEEVCIPILEKKSNLICGVDFKIGYSPERINPGDKINTLEKIVKVVSGMDAESLEIIDRVYSEIIDAGTYRAPSIKVAEASKVIENAQRDVNIAFMNELSMVFNLMGIDTSEVLKAAGTKWNFLNFKPGLVGGHCIGVDPYYFTYKADILGYHSEIILAGRKINDDMPKYVVKNLIQTMIKNKININKVKIGFFGITFKENCPDTRNSKNLEVLYELLDLGLNVKIYDTEVDATIVRDEHGITLDSLDKNEMLDVIIVTVPHASSTTYLREYIKSNDKIILFDLQNYFSEFKNSPNVIYWSL